MLESYTGIGNRRRVQGGHFPPMGFGSILLNVLIILVFNNKWL